MNRFKKLLFGGGAAALLLTGLTLVSSGTAEASAQEPGDCTFCTPYQQSCNAFNPNWGTQICYRRVSGNGACPPCTPCKKLVINPFD